MEGDRGNGSRYADAMALGESDDGLLTMTLVGPPQGRFGPSWPAERRTRPRDGMVAPSGRQMTADERMDGRPRQTPRPSQKKHTAGKRLSRSRPVVAWVEHGHREPGRLRFLFHSPEGRERIL